MTEPSQLYPRYLKPGCATFDPLELAKQTEEIVCQGDRRKYTRFYRASMYGGIATGYTCGCCLRCIFCWVSWSRDFPERYGEFRTPREAFDRLYEIARKSGVDVVRISGAEPTLGKAHLLGLLERVERSSFRQFILETNGILLGADSDYAGQIVRFRKVHTRVALKAGTPEAFTRKTGAEPESFELPFRGIVNLLDAGASFHVASMTGDPRIVPDEERQGLLDRLARIHPSLIRELEEESISPYPNAVKRLRHARARLTWQ